MLHVVEVRKSAVTAPLLNTIRRFTENLNKVDNLLKPETVATFDVDNPARFINEALQHYWIVKPMYRMQELVAESEGRRTTAQFITDDDNNRLVFYIDSKLVNGVEQFEVYLGYDGTMRFNNEVFRQLGLTTNDWRFTA